MLLPRSRYVRDEFDLSASNNLIAPSPPSVVSVLNENKMKQIYVATEIEFDEG
jgi:hypothetical protein